MADLGCRQEENKALEKDVHLQAGRTDISEKGQAKQQRTCQRDH
jgi:hypothetical protein